MSVAEVVIAEASATPAVLELGEVCASAHLRLSDAVSAREAARAVTPEGAPVVSFDGVEACDELFVQEAIVDVAREAWSRHRQVALAVGALPAVAEVLDRVLRRSGFVMWSFERGQGRLLGADPRLVRCLEAARELGTFSLPVFQARLQATATVAENRLGLMVRLGAVQPAGDCWRSV